MICHVKGLSDYATTQSLVIAQNYLKTKRLAEDALKINKSLNKEFAGKDELGKIIFTEDGDYDFTGEAPDQLNEAWEKYLEDTTHKIDFIQFTADSLKVRIIKQGRHEFIGVELPGKFIDPLIEFGIITIPDKGPNEPEPAE